MNPIHRDSRFRDRILEAYSGLPPQQRLVADFALEHLQDVAFLGIPGVAGQCGVSEATVVRFAKNIGFRGFAQLKAALLEALREKVATPATEAAVPEALLRSPEDNTLSSVAKQEAGNIEHCIRNLMAVFSPQPLRR